MNKKYVKLCGCEGWEKIAFCLMSVVMNSDLLLVYVARLCTIVAMFSSIARLKILNFPYKLYGTSLCTRVAINGFFP
jgi:hypothetical protein